MPRSAALASSSGTPPSASCRAARWCRRSGSGTSDCFALAVAPRSATAPLFTWQCRARLAERQDASVHNAAHATDRRQRRDASRSRGTQAQRELIGERHAAVRNCSAGHRQDRDAPLLRRVNIAESIGAVGGLRSGAPQLDRQGATRIAVVTQSLIARWSGSLLAEPCLRCGRSPLRSSGPRRAARCRGRASDSVPASPHAAHSQRTLSAFAAAWHWSPSGAFHCIDWLAQHVDGDDYARPVMTSAERCRSARRTQRAPPVSASRCAFAAARLTLPSSARDQLAGHRSMAGQVNQMQALPCHAPAMAADHPATTRRPTPCSTPRRPTSRSTGSSASRRRRAAAAWWCRRRRARREAGVAVLDAGGNAIDAAVATALALATHEPWNSGLGGIGFALVHRAGQKRAEVVDFGPRAPAATDPGALQADRAHDDGPVRLAGGRGRHQHPRPAVGRHSVLGRRLRLHAPAMGQAAAGRGDRTGHRVGEARICRRTGTPR